MVTLCWAAKGGSGTTVVTAALALGHHGHSLLVDLDGELASVLGLPPSERPGVDDWLHTQAPADQLGELIVQVDDTTSLLPHRGEFGPPADRPPPERRLVELADWLVGQRDHGVAVYVDAGTAAPPLQLATVADQVLLVTRPCYLSLRRARSCTVRPTGIVLVDEPGRAYRHRDLEHALGAPIVATVSVDPAVARAVDAGLLASRLPSVIGRELRRMAS